MIVKKFSIFNAKKITNGDFFDCYEIENLETSKKQQGGFFD